MSPARFSTTPESSYDTIAGRRSVGQSSSSRVMAAACTSTQRLARSRLRNLNLVDGQRVDATRWMQANRAHHDGPSPSSEVNTARA